MQENYIVAGVALGDHQLDRGKKMFMSWALNGYTENDAAMVGTDCGISLHL